MPGQERDGQLSPGTRLLQRAAHATQSLNTLRYDAGARVGAHAQLTSARTTMDATHGKLSRDAVTGCAGGALLELKAEARHHRDGVAVTARDELLRCVESLISAMLLRRARPERAGAGPRDCWS